MHVLLILEGLLVQHFIFLLLCGQPLSKTSIISNFAHDVVLGVSSADKLVTN